MITTVLSLTFGAGIYMMFDGLTNPRRPAMPGWLRSARESLVRAGLREVSLREFVLFSLASGILAGFLGTAIASAQYHALLGVAILFVAYIRKTRLEEEILSRVFPTDYDAYRRATWRLVPPFF